MNKLKGNRFTWSFWNKLPFAWLWSKSCTLNRGREFALVQAMAVQHEPGKVMIVNRDISWHKARAPA